MAVKLKKVIVPEPEGQYEFDNNLSPRLASPELTLANSEAKALKFTRLREAREKQVKTFQVPEGWVVKLVIDHEDSDESFNRNVQKEVDFWQKYKPQLELKVERFASVSIVLCRKSK